MKKKAMWVVILVALIFSVSPVLASGLPKRFSWTVNWGVWDGTGWVTWWSARSQEPVRLRTTTYYRCLLPSSVERTIAEGTSFKCAGPPRFDEVSGFQVGYPGQDSFAGMIWYSGQCTPGPEISLQRWPRPVVAIRNYTNSFLYATTDGGRKWTKIPAMGGFFQKPLANKGSVRLYKTPDIYSPLCAEVWWR